MKVVIVVPPFGPLQYPMLGPSLLKAELRAEGIDCDLDYALFDFAQRIGFDEYVRTFYADPPLLLGERIFARALFGDAVPPVEEYWERVVRPFAAPFAVRIEQRSMFDERLRFLRRAESAAIAFADEAARSPALAAADVVGFSSTFAQHAASLAIAQRLRALHPDKPIVFGGANCFGEMGAETLASFPFVDWVCTGEGDAVFAPLLRAIAAGERPSLPGVIGRGDASVARVVTASIPLDAMPVPDFDDFFACWERHPGERARVLAIPVEGARGCWWGERQHCVFCGIAPEQMPFRRKSAPRLHAEIEAQIARHGITDVWASDYILDMAAFDDLIPLLTEKRSHREIFFEVKANLDRGQLEALADAGATRLQPGIESLDTSVLRLMRKGTTSWQNLQLLKWAREIGVALQWNLLCGFPGEDPEAYARMARLAAAIPHLPPPRACSQITIDRFSPLFRDPAAFGMEIHPARGYRYVYALPEPARRRLAYFFSHRGPGELDTTETVAVPSYAAPLAQQVRLWQRLHARVRLEWWTRSDGAVEIADSRPGYRTASHVLEGALRDVFLALDPAIGRRSLDAALARAGSPPLAADVDAALERLAADDLVAALDGRWLALPTRRPSQATVAARSTAAA